MKTYSPFCFSFCIPDIFLNLLSKLFDMIKKGILLFVAVLLIGFVVYAIWYINRRGELANNSKDSFIPYNSAVVVSLNPGAGMSEKIHTAFADDIRELRQKPLYKMADTLLSRNFAASTSRILAIRLEGKNKPAFLWVMDNRDVLSKNEIVNFLKNAFGDTQEKIRKYDSYRIHSLTSKEKNLYYAVEEGMILLSDSELYIEDALKQFESQAEGKKSNAHYENINKYFSPGAGMNIFLNTACFSELLPMLMQTEKLFPGLNITQCFRWGALDGDISESGVALNGFMHYSGLNASFMKTLEGQRPRESSIENIIPVYPQSLLLLNLSDIKEYLTALDRYRYDSGSAEKIRKRKQECSRLMGKNAETELKELLQGEFAWVSMSFNETNSETEGAVIAGLKSGGLCRAWMENVVGVNARLNSVHPDSYRYTCKPDKDQAFSFYRLPVEDLAALYWGPVFENVKTRYALVVENYLILASSEKVVADFLKTHIHHNYIKDADWFKQIKGKMSAKYNLAYFAEMTRTLPYYKHVASGGLKKYIASSEESLSAFSTLAMQWSNEGHMLYTTFFLSTDEVQTAERPHVLWQTKLGKGMRMKPVPVVNHNTQERELFVQDEAHTVYLLNNSGRILWKQKIDGKINSEVYQVDALKNGKLQYLFSTSSRIYLIDRNGDAVTGFPVAFKSACHGGITLFDYDNNRTYRIFAPCADQKIYLYDIKGTVVKGWKSVKSDKEIVTRVQHYRVEGKDYIVYADRYRLYILDRKGNERVRVSTLFDLAENTDLYLTRREGKMMIAFTNKKGPVNLVDFNGKVKQLKCGEYSEESISMNVADVNNDGADEFIFTVGGKLAVYDQMGKNIYEKDLNAQGLDFPYVYRFSNGDVRIGLVDTLQHNMFMLSLKNGVSTGFPISGESPFSIIFADNGDFYLFAGVENGSLIKYKVQR